MDINTLVEGYLAAWNAADPAARQHLLAEVWAADGRYTDPQSHAANRAELDAVIGGFHAGNPGAVFRLAGQVDHHHGHVRFYWQLRLANGVDVPGMDYGEVSAEGQLVRIVGFF